MIGDFRADFAQAEGGLKPQPLPCFCRSSTKICLSKDSLFGWRMHYLFLKALTKIGAPASFAGCLDRQRMPAESWIVLRLGSLPTKGAFGHPARTTAGRDAGVTFSYPLIVERNSGLQRHAFKSEVRNYFNFPATNLVELHSERCQSGCPYSFFASRWLCALQPF